MAKKHIGSNTSRNRENHSPKEWKPSCKKYNSCEREEKYQGRCNERCCPGFRWKKAKK